MASFWQILQTIPAMAARIDPSALFRITVSLLYYSDPEDSPKNLTAPFQYLSFLLNYCNSVFISNSTRMKFHLLNDGVFSPTMHWNNMIYLHSFDKLIDTKIKIVFLSWI